MKGVYAAAVVLAMLFVSQVFAANLWYDNFNDNKLDPKYIVKYDPQEAGNGAKWVEEDGVLKQTEPVPGDATYCIIKIPNAPQAIGALAKIRFDDYQDHDRSRAGVGVWLDPNDHYNGYTFVYTTTSKTATSNSSTITGHGITTPELFSPSMSASGSGWRYS